MSDRIAIMERGRIAQMGPPREVYEKPQSSFVASFLGEANLLRVRRDGTTARGPCGSVLVTAEGGLATAEGLAFVRPEKVRVEAGSMDAGPNRLAGKVLHASFLGNIVRYEIDVGDGATVLCDAANGAGVEPHRPGDTVALSWRAEDSRFLVA